MSQEIGVLAMGPHEFAVTVTEGADTTSHRVVVSEDLIDDLALYGRTITLDQISDRYDDYVPELQARLAT